MTYTANTDKNRKRTTYYYYFCNDCKSYLTLDEISDSIDEDLELPLCSKCIAPLLNFQTND